MYKLRLHLALFAILVFSTACAAAQNEQPTNSPPSTVSAVTLPVPTPLPDATHVPWWGPTISTLDIEPKFLGKPTDLAVLQDGTLFVADAGYHRILRIDLTGKVIRVWGQFSGSDASQAAPNGTFNEPWGLAVTPDGSAVYVADTWNHRIQVFRVDGTFVNAWGEPGIGAEPYQFFGPRDITVSADGYVIVSDTGNKRFVVYSQDGQYISQLGGEGSGPGQFNEPVGIAISPNGDLYVADQGNRRVQVLSIAEDGTLTPKTAWSVEAWENFDLLYKPYICVLEQSVFITDSQAGSVLQYSLSGEYIATYNFNTTGYLNYGLLYGIAADPDGGLWVSDLAGGAGVLVKIYPIP